MVNVSILDIINALLKGVLKKVDFPVIIDPGIWAEKNKDTRRLCEAVKSGKR